MRSRRSRRADEAGHEGSAALRAVASRGAAGSATRGAAAYDPATDPALRMGGIALKNGLVLVSEHNWSAAIREENGSISVASGRKPRLPGTGGPGRTPQPRAQDGARRGAAGTQRGPRLGLRPGTRPGPWRGGRFDPADVRTGGLDRRPVESGIPLLRGLGRFGESLLVLGLVKSRLPNAGLPIEGGRVLAALAASAAATSAVRAAAPRSALVQEAGAALASFVPAMWAVKNTSISGYHGAEHKVIGGREAALRAAAREAGDAGDATATDAGDEGAALATGVAPTADAAPSEGAAPPADATPSEGAAPPADATPSEGAAVPAGAEPLMGDSAAAAKEHDRCGTNLVGPYLLATVLTNVLARGRKGEKTPVSSAIAGAASLGLALEALRWASKHGDSVLARLMLVPGRAIQKRLTTTEPTPDQLEVGRRALEELLRLEGAGA